MRNRLMTGMVLTVALASQLEAEVLYQGQSDAGTEFQVEELISGQGVPWALAFADDQTLLFTERGGRIKRLRLDTGEVSVITGTPEVLARGQGGLLDLARPQGQNRDWYYLTWVKAMSGQGVTVLSRARLEGDALVQWQDLLVAKSGSNTQRHFGSRIAFDSQGYLYLSIGDRGHRPNGQDLGTHAGSILRLMPDGQVPPDNPFVGQPGAQPEIWSYGHRNPQGLAWDAGSARLWANEHGPRGGDEINLIVSGGNYGWPRVSHGQEYWGPLAVGDSTEAPDVVAPVKVYIPSIAPGSLLYYSGAAFPQWQGSLFSGALAQTHLNRVTLNAAGEAVAEERLLGQLQERIRALQQGPRGWLYLSTDSGRILRLRPVDATEP